MAKVQQTQPRAAATDTAADADGTETPKRTGRRRRMKRIIRKVVRAELCRASGGSARRRNPTRRRRLMRKMRRLARLLRRN